MKLESQVCSLEYANQLYGLGIKRDSLFYWVLFQDWSCVLYGKFTEEYYRDCFCAYTLAELREFFSMEMYSGKDSDGNDFCTVLLPNGNELTCYDNTETNARAKMAIHLIKEGYIKV